MKFLRPVGAFAKWLGRTFFRVAGMDPGSMDAPAGPSDYQAADYLYKPAPPEYRP